MNSAIVNEVYVSRYKLCDDFAKKQLGELVTNDESQTTAKDLKHQQHNCQRPFMHWPEKLERQIYDGQVVDLGHHHTAFVPVVV